MKQLLLAGILLAYASMLVNPNPDQVSEIKAEQIVITNDVALVSSPADMSAYGLGSGNETCFEQITMSESLRMFSEDGSGILFYAKPDGQESRLAAPVLNEAAQEMGIHVYYVNCGEDYNLSDYNTLTGYISSTFAVSQNGTKTFFLPDVIAVKDGEITGYHVSLVDGLILTGTEESLPEDQRIRLKNSYIETLRTAAD